MSYWSWAQAKVDKMSAVKGFSAQGARPAPIPRTWEQTPWWHFRYWMGYRMRIAVGLCSGTRPWAYRSHNHHARVVLEAQATGVPIASYDPEGAYEYNRAIGGRADSGRKPKF